MVELLELGPVIEVAQVGELVAQRVDQARIAQRLPGHRVVEADLDGSVGEAGAVAARHASTLGFERPVAQ